MDWLSGIPILIALPLFAVVPAAIAVIAHSIFRKYVPPEALIEQHEVAGFLVSVVGVLYSVVLGFLVGTVWTAFATAQQTIDMEAGYLADAFGYASNVQEPQRSELQRIFAKYAIGVHDSAWSVPQHGEQDPQSIKLINDAAALTFTMPPPAHASPGAVLEASMVRTELLDGIRNIADTRRLRLIQAQSRLPPGMYEALGLGAIMVIAFAFFFGVKNYFKQMLMTALVAGSIGLFLGLIVELSTPYSGSIRVSRDAWTFVIENNHLERYLR
ncbi:MAG: hypothetical protein WA814_01905 [Candidatus Baltobacteraceae bacterium]